MRATLSHSIRGVMQRSPCAGIIVSWIAACAAMTGRAEGGEHPHKSRLFPARRKPPRRPLSFPHPRWICAPRREWQMQDHPRAPGIARQGTLGTDGPAACGGAAAQSSAPGQTRPRATPMPTAPDHARSRATAHAQGVGPHAVRHHAHAHAERAGSREPWPGACRPVLLLTIPWPAWVRRLLSAVLSRVAATPGTRPAHLSTARVAPVADPAYAAWPVLTRPLPTTASMGGRRHRQARAPPRTTHRKPTRGREGGAVRPAARGGLSTSRRR